MQYSSMEGGAVWRTLATPAMWVFDRTARLAMSRADLAARFPLGYVATGERR